jgi:hypothetical protein
VTLEIDNFLTIKYIMETSFQGLQEIDVNSLLENGKIKYKVWKRLTVGQRWYVVEEINDENFDSSILDEIAPQLQRGDLPDDYPHIQRLYAAKIKGKYRDF